MSVDGGCGGLCREILATIPEWFGIPEANDDYGEMADRSQNVVARIGGEDVGLLTLVRHSNATAEIHLVAVRRDKRGLGCGRAMVSEVERLLAQDGARFLQVKTLSSASNDPGYAETRRFYDAMGFEVFEEMPNLWDPSNPAVILIKAIG